jgi:hypothetical protein
VEQKKSRHPERSEGPLYFVFVFASAVAFVVAVLHTTHPAESRVSEGVEQQKSRHPERSEGPLYFVFVFALSCLHTFMQSALMACRAAPAATRPFLPGLLLCQNGASHAA